VIRSSSEDVLGVERSVRARELETKGFTIDINADGLNLYLAEWHGEGRLEGVGRRV
jgi:hypothetical protein